MNENEEDNKQIVEIVWAINFPLLADLLWCGQSFLDL